MPTSRSSASRPAIALALAAAALLPATARADLANEVSGDFTAVPLYRAFTFAGVDQNAIADPGYLGEHIFGVDYASNLAPKPLATASASLQLDGASFQANGWSAWSGFYAGRNAVSMSVANANANDTYYVVAGQGSATSVQFFTPEASAARATFTWHVSGIESNPSGVGTTTGRLDFAATTESGKSWIDLFTGGFSNQLFEYGTGTYTYSLPIVDLGTPIYLHYWSSAYAQVNAGEVPQGSSFNLAANYGNTFVLEDVQLYDANDQAITEWTMEDQNLGQAVFDQNGRIDAILPPPAVPEPGTWALLLAGLGATGFLQRRRAAATGRAA